MFKYMTTVAATLLLLIGPACVNDFGTFGDEAGVATTAHALALGVDDNVDTDLCRNFRFTCPPGFHHAPHVCVCVPDVAVPCGDTYCGEGQVCCDARCGICGSGGPLATACPDVTCPLTELPEPELEDCGPGACPQGLTCCNQHCGICSIEATDAACNSFTCAPFLP